jgi:hypothetical protein
MYLTWAFQRCIGRWAECGVALEITVNSKVIAEINLEKVFWNFSKFVLMAGLFLFLIPKFGIKGVNGRLTQN